MSKLARGVLVLAAAGLAACGGDTAPEKAEVVRPIRTVTVGDVEPFDASTLPGTARAAQEVDLSFRVAGPLVGRPVNVGSDDLPQVWDELRRKVAKAAPTLPPGAGPSDVVDDYGDVFGFQLAVVGDGFEHEDVERWAKFVRKERVTVDGVPRVDLVGVQERRVYLNVSETQLSQIGTSEQSIENTLRAQTVVVQAGEFTSPQDIANLSVRPTLFDSLQQSGLGDQLGNDSQLIRIGDAGLSAP